MRSVAPRNDEALQEVLILDDETRVAEALQRSISRAGFYSCTRASSTVEALDFLKSTEFDLLLIDIHLKKNGGEEDDGLKFLHDSRTRGYRNLAMVCSGDKSCAQFVRAANAGANDYWVKLGALSVGEAVNLITRRFENGWNGELRPTGINEVCYFKCVGCSRKDIEYLQTFYDMKFPSFATLAESRGDTKDAVKQRFYRIYQRLGIRHSTQLIEVLAACSFYRR